MISVSFHDLGSNEPAWPNPGNAPIDHNQATGVRVMVLDGGMTSGRPSVAIGIESAAGARIVRECSAREFVAAARAIQARYPDLLQGD